MRYSLTDSLKHVQVRTAGELLTMVTLYHTVPSLSTFSFRDCLGFLLCDEHQIFVFLLLKTNIIIINNNKENVSSGTPPRGTEHPTLVKVKYITHTHNKHTHTVIHTP